MSSAILRFTKSRTDFEPGQFVHVIKGPLEGLTGYIESVRPGGQLLIAPSDHEGMFVLVSARVVESIGFE
jgi:hypothetical protein